ncbi:hypothetical protein B0O80DRAFT_498322 [Mortierella sp. GBAus27b]|nr:hypothetical protein BGX31_006496 [Mortierella sp. GBA43]KAI8354309.1 hypothetical protein B0O80DRAFT_498322 [Mortierella sp. GBAus27b]
MGKQAKTPKPSKLEKQQRKERNAYPLAGSSLLAQSERYIKEVPNARPFEDMAYFVGAFMIFFIWRLTAAVKSQSQGSIEVWTLLTFGCVALINVWTFFLGMVSAKRRGDIGLLRINESDIMRFALLSGIIGIWLSLLLFRYRPEDKFFYAKLLAATVFNMFWAVIYIRYYML